MTPRSSKLKKLSSEALADLFAESALARGIAVENSKPEVGNAHFKVVDNIYREIKARGIDGQNALLPLLDHSDPEIRLHAASLALEFAPSLATPVLESLRQLEGLIGYDADGVLKEWRKGTLHFP